MNNLAPPQGPPLGGMNPGFMEAKTGKQRNFPPPNMSGGEGIRDISRRLRMLEEQYSSIRRNIQVSEQSVIKIGKETKADTAVLHSEISEIKTQIAEIKDELKLIVQELKATAKNEDVMVIEKYVNLWEPIKFCTQKDVENIVRRMINK